MRAPRSGIDRPGPWSRRRASAGRRRRLRTSPRHRSSCGCRASRQRPRADGSTGSRTRGGSAGCARRRAPARNGDQSRQNPSTTRRYTRDMTLARAIQALWDDLEAVRADVLREVTGLSQGQADWKPTEKEWSAGEVINHLTIAEIATGKLTTKLTREA